MNPYDLLIREPSTLLRNLSAWLDKARAWAVERKFNTEVLLHARLAPDQFPLLRQIQSACDAAKGNAARLSGREVPIHPDVETSVEDVQARIETVLAYLGTFQPGDFADIGSRTVSLGWMRGRYLEGPDYLVQFAVPNFHFHVTHAYAILRHNGVPLGKIDFLGSLSLKEPAG